MAGRPNDAGWGQYVARAFTWRWNMLAFGAAMVLAMISGVPDVAVPLVLAAEVTYLGAIVGNPKFRTAIEAQRHAAVREAQEETRPVTSAEDRLRKALGALDLDRRHRFTQLRDRCIEMQRIAAGVRGHAGAAGDDLHMEALDRMLWVFLRLLASQKALTLFVDTTDAAALHSRVSELEARITEAKEGDNDKIRRALIDSVATAQLRVNNLLKAEHNAEFVEIELDRIEDKIQALVEMAVSHEDPDFISSQVDSVAASISHTEEAMREMSFLPGVDSEMDESAPSILSVSA